MSLFDIFKRRNKTETTPVENNSDQKPSQSNSEGLKANSSQNISQNSNTEEQTDISEETLKNAVETKSSDEIVKDAPVQEEHTTSANSEVKEESQPEENKEATTVTNQVSTDDENLESPDLTSDVKGSAEEAENESVKYQQGLAKSRSTFGQRLNALFANFRSVDESFFDDLEDLLIQSDVGFETSMKITDELRDEVKLENVKKKSAVQNVIIKKMIDIYEQAGNDENSAINVADSGPTVILFVGVNGVGKTTTIGKMAKMYKDQNKKVLLVAADTFRAGAIEQLNVWAKRDQVDIVKGKAGGDPSSVVFDGVRKAKTDSYDILMVDTAGRLQNKANLMNELTKMKKVLTREIPSAPHEVLLVLDATTGQNALSQAKTFKEATDVSGIVITKLDGTARGGIILAIRNELHLPVKYVGLGEKVTDLQVFDANEFIYGLFKGLINE